MAGYPPRPLFARLPAVMLAKPLGKTGRDSNPQARRRAASPARERLHKRQKALAKFGIGYIPISANERQNLTRRHVVVRLPGSRIACHAVEEIIDIDTQELRDLIKPARRQPVAAVFILLHLLERQPERRRDIGLAEAERNTALLQLPADMGVDRSTQWIFKCMFHTVSPQTINILLRDLIFAYYFL